MDLIGLFNLFIAVGVYCSLEVMGKMPHASAARRSNTFK